LTIIRGHLDSALTSDGTIEPELRRDIEVMHGEALRLQRLIDDLFALSRAEVGTLTFHPQPCDVTATLKRCAEAASPAAWRTQRVEIVVESAAALPPILVDPERLEQILFNLINNAVRHSPPGGLVHLSAAQDGDSIRIDVADTGEGIAPDELNLIWDRFYRGRNAKDARGSGIGLSLVRELTEAMGGAVCVASTLGEGAQFTLRFPIVRTQSSSADSAAETSRIPQATASPLPAASQR
jgi:two-component system sensor histidine kinase BaeS